VFIRVEAMKNVILFLLLVMAAGFEPAAAQTYAERYGTKFILGGNAAGTTPLTILAPATGLSSYTLTLPQAAGSSGQTLITTDANGTLGWMSLSGTTNYLPKWSGSNFANSSLLDNGTTITTSENLTLSGANTLQIGTPSTATGSVALANSSSSNLTTLQAGNATAAVTYKLPTSNGTSGQVLGTDGNNPAQLRWLSAGSGSGMGAIGASYLARAPLNTYSTTGTNSNVPVNVEGISFPIGAGEIWSFKMDVSTRCATNTNGMMVGFSLPTNALIEAEVHGLVDLGANGHTVYYRITAAGQMVGPYNQVTNNDAGISIFGTVDNSAGSAGTVRLQIAAPSSGDAGLKTVYKNSFITAWQYAVAYERTYTSSTTYTVPSGITKIYASGVSGAGGGGGGGGDNGGTGGGSGGGGGAGEYVPPLALTVSPGETLTITVGTGGNGGSAGTSGGTLSANGSAGSLTSIVGSVSGTLLSVNGGSGGGRGHNSTLDPTNAAAGTAGTGGTGSTTTGHVNGNSGSAGVAGSNGNDRAGGAGGSGPAPNNSGGSGGVGNGNNSNGTAGSQGGDGYVTISY
jgi:hypothetical protein